MTTQKIREELEEKLREEFEEKAKETADEIRAEIREELKEELQEEAKEAGWEEFSALAAAELVTAATAELDGLSKSSEAVKKLMRNFLSATPATQREVAAKIRALEILDATEPIAAEPA